MPDFKSILNLITFSTNSYYKSYKVHKDVLFLIKSNTSTSSIYRIKEIVNIYSIAKEQNYSCILLCDDTIKIKKE